MGDAWLEHATSCLRGKSGQTIRRESAWSRAISPLTRAETTGNHRVLLATFWRVTRRVDASKEEETVLPGDHDGHMASIVRTDETPRFIF
jgi:hypothetical protein